MKSYLFYFGFVHITDVPKYVNAAINAPETYSVPKRTNSMPKYLEIIYDENDDDRLPPLNPYEIPLPPLDELEILQTTSSHTPCEKSIEFDDSFELDSAANIREIKHVKSRTVSTSSTVSETSVYNAIKKKEQLNVQSEENDLAKPNNVIITAALSNPNYDRTDSNEPLLLPQQQSNESNNNNSRRKLQQMYANTHIENAIRSCDGITSM